MMHTLKSEIRDELDIKIFTKIDTETTDTKCLLLRNLDDHLP